MSTGLAPAQEASRAEDAAMVQAVRDGEVGAYRGLVEKYQQRVYTIIFGVLRNQEDARDLTQDAFVKAYNSLDGFRLESSFFTWLYRIAMNLAIDATRRKKRRPTSSFDEEVATREADGGIAETHHDLNPRRELERKELYGRIMDAIDTLPDDQKQVILLREVDGLSYKEIAEVLDVAEGTVMSRLFYARKKLQKLLAEFA